MVALSHSLSDYQNLFPRHARSRLGDYSISGVVCSSIKEESKSDPRGGEEELKMNNFLAEEWPCMAMA